jgi:hypothetical protein
MHDGGVVIATFYWTKHLRVGVMMMKKTAAALMVGLYLCIAGNVGVLGRGRNTERALPGDLGS